MVLARNKTVGHPVRILLLYPPLAISKEGAGLAYSDVLHHWQNWLRLRITALFAQGIFDVVKSLAALLAGSVPVMVSPFIIAIFTRPPIAIRASVFALVEVMNVPRPFTTGAILTLHQ